MLFRSVEGVTKLTRVQYSTMEEQQMENLRKMFMAMSKDIRVILIKISDRLHNTRTLQYQTPAKQISKSMETMEVYAPLAHRLGMQKIKWEPEDTSLQYLDPEGYQEIIDYLKKNEDSANSFMNAIQSKITTRLASVGIHGSTSGTNNSGQSGTGTTTTPNGSASTNQNPTPNGSNPNGTSSGTSGNGTDTSK